MSDRSPVPASGASAAAAAPAAAVAAGRLAVTMGHLKPTPCAAKSNVSGELKADAFPMQRTRVLKWNGWGFRDSGFSVNDKGVVEFHGQRYELDGAEMPHLRDWVATKGLYLEDSSPSQVSVADVPQPINNAAFVSEIEGQHSGFSFDAEDRLFHAHGHTCQEIYKLRHGKFERIPDAVVWPENSAHVEAIVKAADRHNVVIIPFGGGTTVTGSLLCPENEQRMIVSLDTSRMCRVLWVDHVNMMARIEAGVVGVELEKTLAKEGVCTGHQPDSNEFSTVGGWVATRASGMKKNVYGNMEDLLVSCKIVTPKGVIEKSCTVPRISCGPDIHHFILGSEGTLGVVTEVTMKVRKLPEATSFGSYVFPNFSNGVAFMHEIALKRYAPASIRLVDNEQFQFGHALKPKAASYVQSFVDKLKTFYVTKIKGFDPNQLTVATCLFEGTTAEIALQQKRIADIASKYGGMAAGEENGKRGYFLTFVIAYIRDLGFEHMYLGESFETSVPWDCVEDLCRNTKDRIRRECVKLGIKEEPLVSCRVTQTYDTGACVYFYFGFPYKTLADPLHAFHVVEVAARDECIANGGSISHHHGVGKVRKQWVEQTLSSGGVEMLRAVKQRIDPKNIFANGNLIP